MKLLNLKYKMHKLVNLVFYLIIFGIGFLLGFGVEKININKLISQFLFIDNVSAEELNCVNSDNLFVKENLLNNTINNPTITFNDNSVIVSGKTWYSGANFEILLEPGTYTFSVDAISGGLDIIEMREFTQNEDGTISSTYLGNLIGGTPKTYEFIEETTIGLRFYNTLTQGHSNLTTTFTNVQIIGQICEKEVTVDIVNDSFYSFSQKIFGEVSEENKFIYDFITFGLVVTCFTLFVLVVGYIFNKFFGG